MNLSRIEIHNGKAFWASYSTFMEFPVLRRDLHALEASADAIRRNGLENIAVDFVVCSRGTYLRDTRPRPHYFEGEIWVKNDSSEGEFWDLAPTKPREGKNKVIWHHWQWVRTNKGSMYKAVNLGIDLDIFGGKKKLADLPVIKHENLPQSKY